MRHGRRAHRAGAPSAGVALEADVDGGAVRVQALGVGDGADRRGERREAVAGQPLDLDELAELLDRQRARRAGEPARRQDVVRARRVVAGRFGRPPADEEAARRCGSRRPSARDRVATVDRQVLRAVAVDERDRAVEVRREDDPAVIGERAFEDRRAVVPWRDGAGRRPRRRRRTPRRSSRGWPGESGPCSACVSRSAATSRGSAVASARTRPSDGPAGRSMPTSPASSSFAAVTQALPGPTIAVDRPAALAPAGRRPARRSPGRRRRRGRSSTPSRAAVAERSPGRRGRRASAGEATTIAPTPATCAGTTVITSDEGRERNRPGRSSRRADGRPAALDLDAFDDRHPGRRGSLGLGEPADVGDGRLEGGAQGRRLRVGRARPRARRIRGGGGRRAGRRRHGR